MSARLVVKKRSKYRAVRTMTPDGRIFASKKEANRWGELKLLEAAGKIIELKPQVTFQLYVKDVWITTYVADFVYYDEERNHVIEDCKGYLNPKDPFTRLYLVKKALMLACHGIEIREV